MKLEPLELTTNERQQLLHCIDQSIKTASNSLQAAALLLPLAEKIDALQEAKEEAVKDGNADS